MAWSGSIEIWLPYTHIAKHKPDEYSAQISSDIQDTILMIVKSAFGWVLLSKGYKCLLARLKTSGTNGNYIGTDADYGLGSRLANVSNQQQQHVDLPLLLPQVTRYARI